VKFDRDVREALSGKYAAEEPQKTAAPSPTPAPPAV
jgi:hypothetical protein